MPLLLGTRDAVYRVSDTSAQTIERLLDAGGKVYGLTETDGAWFAATSTGLYRTTDFDTWTALDLPNEREFITSVAVSPDDQRLYAGTMPAELYFSDDDGDTWRESGGFRQIESREQWWNPDVTPHVRTLVTPPETTDRLVSGIDGGGVHVSDDRGESWNERRGGIVNFLHHIVALGSEEYVAASDAGVFWTRDGGRWWDYLYGDTTEHRYFRGVFADDRTVYSGGARSHPPVWNGEDGADAALYRIELQSPPSDHPEDRDITVDRVPYPGEPREIVLSGTTFEDQLVAGTNDGRLLRRSKSGWETASVLETKSQIRCLLSY